MHPAADLHRMQGARAPCCPSRRCSPTAPLHVCRVAATDKKQPVWTGDALLSKFVNMLINNKFLFGAMKVLAKQEMKKTAAQKGVYWDQIVQQRLAESRELEAIKAELEDHSIQYPSYYLVPFHSYDKGNLDWLAAYEVDPATYVMALRTFKTEDLTPQAALSKLRRGITDRLSAYIAQHQLAQPAVIVDVGCATGISTRHLAECYPQADVTGIDLSPYFLALAEQFERRRPAGTKRITYRHALLERNGLPDHSVDLLAFQFIAHECPADVLRTFIQEARRLVRPGGVLMFADNNPKSKTIQNLPPALFTLMKSTEPHTDSYYSFDMEAAMREAGFRHVITQEADHRHRVVLGVAPQ